MADNKNTVLFPYETLKKLCMDAFQKFGFDEKEADIIQRLRETVSGTDGFLDKAKRYMDITELTPELLRLFIQRIEFFGFGASGIVALDAQHKFFRLGVTSLATSDGHMQVMSATLLGPGDCVVIISNSGRTRDLMDAADIARKNGATTIAITASGSPLASACQVHLAADHPEGYDRYSPMVSRLMHLLIIDVLATCVALRIGSSLQPILQQMKENLRAKRYA